MRFFLLALSELGRARIRGLLFDNLVSDLQIFLSAKTVLAEEWRAGPGERSLASSLSTIRHTKTSNRLMIDRQLSVASASGSCQLMHTPIEGFDPGSE